MRDVNSKNLARLESNDVNKKSAVVKHVYSQDHHMDWNNSNFDQKTDLTKNLRVLFIH